MALNRIHEEQELAPGLRAVYEDARAAFDLPFVPDVIKLAAGCPAYLEVMWDDLGPVVRSREFEEACQGLEDVARSLAISGGWRFHDQHKILTGQRFSHNDVEMLSLLAATYTHALPRLALFTRLMQRGYGGGKRGRISAGKRASAMARLLTLHVPGEREAGLRTWLIYSDIRKTTGGRPVPSLFRVLSPFPGYLAAVWMQAKKLFASEDFQRARDEAARRALGAISDLPVRDHRALAKGVKPAEWREIEQMVDSEARLAPQMALFSVVWQRSFPQRGGQFLAA